MFLFVWLVWILLQRLVVRLVRFLSECNHVRNLFFLSQLGRVRLCLFGLFHGLLLLRHGLRTSIDLAVWNDNSVHGVHLFFRHHRIELFLKFVRIFTLLVGEELVNVVSLGLGVLHLLVDRLEVLNIDLLLQIIHRILILLHDLCNFNVIHSRLQLHALFLKHLLLAV